MSFDTLRWAELVRHIVEGGGSATVQMAPSDAGEVVIREALQSLAVRPVAEFLVYPHQAAYLKGEGARETLFGVPYRVVDV